jgi:hypothetical protein
MKELTLSSRVVHNKTLVTRLCGSSYVMCHQNVIYVVSANKTVLKVSDLT